MYSEEKGSGRERDTTCNNVAHGTEKRSHNCSTKQMRENIKTSVEAERKMASGPRD